MITRRQSKEATSAAESFKNGVVGTTNTISLSRSEILCNDETMVGEPSEKEKHKKVDLTGDEASIALLLFLYVLQGVPLGLAGSIPMLLQGKNVSYKQQAMFSFVYWPYSVKLIWAPVVDAAYFPWFGRRKSWLVPMQYMIAVFMIIISKNVNDLLGDESSPPAVFALTALFFMMNVFTATQDIAVDGWALTMLSRRNVGWASTCNTVGQTAGFFLGNVVFLALSSPDFCNQYLRSKPEKEGVITLSGYLYFWAIVFFVTTSLVWLLKKENKETNDTSKPTEGIVGTYYQLWKIVRLRPVLGYIAVLFTCKIGFAAADSVTGLKLIEAGVPKETLAMLAIPMVPIQILLPLFISRYTSGPRPMNVFLKAIPFRLLFGLVFIVCVWLANHVREPGVKSFPLYFYITILLVYGFHQVTVYCIFVAMMAFSARVSDPRFGGTYMTMLNTVANLGANWPATMALWFVDTLTWKSCVGAKIEGLLCNDKAQAKLCTDAGGLCNTIVDGYYVESVICVILGFLWLRWKSNEVKRLQELPEESWKCD